MSKLKAVKPKEAEPSRAKIAIYGKPGVGKTWGSLDFPSVYYIDTEGGANLAHYTDKLHKAGGVYFGPEQGSQDFEAVIEQVKALATEKHKFRTLVIDSISKIFNAEITKEAERLGDKDAFGASKKPAIRMSARLMYWIDRLDMNVVLIAHEKAEWAKGEQIGTLPDAGEKLGYELHLCLQIIKAGESRKAIVKKSRLLGFPDASVFDWSYSEFAKRYGKDIMEADSSPIVLASPEQIAEVTRLLGIVKLTDSTKDKWIAENGTSLSEVESSKVDDIIKHLQAKLEVPAILKSTVEKDK